MRAYVGGPGGVNWRRLAARLHLWGGLVTGPLILVLGLRGVSLVFRAEIEKMEYGAPVVAGARPATPSLDAIVAVARTRHPTAEPRALRIPAEPALSRRIA